MTTARVVSASFLLGAALLASAPVHASLFSPAAPETRLVVGETVTGRLADGSRTLTDNSKFDQYVFRGRKGERVTITMRSRDFDTFLFLGRMLGGRWHLVATDDDGAGGTDSRISVILPEDGDYIIRANAYYAHERGEYTLTLESEPAAANHAGPAATRAVRSWEGTLGPGSERLTDGSYLDEYRFQGRQGERVTITMRSSDFDTFLFLGRMIGGQWHLLTTDDDGAGGTDSRIDVVLPEDGEYVIRANAYFAGASGRYTLTLESGGTPSPAPSTVERSVTARTI